MLKSIWLYPVRVAAHFVVAVLSGMIIGGVLEGTLGRVYAHTVIEPYVPCIAVTAFVFGLLVSYRVESVHLASWTWVIGLPWFLLGAHELTHYWDPRWAHTKTAWEYAKLQLVPYNNSCADSECLYFMFYTVPFIASLAYSVGAFAKKQFVSRNPK